MILRTSGQVIVRYNASGVLIIERSFGFRLARNGGHAASRWGGGTLICQNGKGVVLPIAAKLWRRVSSRLKENVGLYESAYRRFGFVDPDIWLLRNAC